MEMRWTFHQCDRAKAHAREYWAKKTQRLARLLTNYGSDVKPVNLTLYNHAEQVQWELRAVLHLPTGTLTVEDTSPTLNEAIDNLTDKLASSIGRHKNELRKRHLHRGRKHRRRQFASASEFLVRDAAANRTSAFAARIAKASQTPTTGIDAKGRLRLRDVRDRPSARTLQRRRRVGLGRSS